MLNEVGATLKKETDDNIIITNAGYADVVSIAKAAFRKALMDTPAKGIFNDRRIDEIREMSFKDETPCRFAGTPEKIQCGSTTITISTKPTVMVLGIEWFGQSFAGYKATYKVSKAWSYQDAIERLKSTSKYSKFAHEVSKYAEELESQGKTKEATYVKKKAFEIAKSGKQAVSPAKFLPGQ